MVGQVRGGSLKSLRHGVEELLVSFCAASKGVVVCAGALLCSFAAGSASAAPAAPIELELRQKDGTAITVRQWGDEWRNGLETLDGYTILKDAKSGNWVYAEKNDSGELVPTAKVAGKDAPAPEAKHLRGADKDSLGKSLRAAAKASRLSPKGTKQFKGSHKVLMLLVRFTDQGPVDSTAADWREQAFGPTDSLRHYYQEVSYGNLSLEPAPEGHGSVNDGVVGWLNLPYPHPDFASNFSVLTFELVRDALVAADPYIDFASYDTDGDGHVSLQELLVVVIVAGYETSYGGPFVSPSVWGHQFGLGVLGVSAPVLDGVAVSDYDRDGGYMMFGEWHATDPDDPDAHRATIGIMCHEIGHGLDMPDLYDIDYSSGGAGEWCLMSGGSWNATTGHAGSLPPHPCAFLKLYQGWTSAYEAGTEEVGIQISQMATSPTIVQVRNNPNGVDWDFGNQSGTGEYFLIENRQKVGYDAGLPGDGLLIWHIDETRTSDNSANAEDTRRLVDVEEADGLDEIDRGFPSDAGDPFPGTTNNTAFYRWTTPNSNLYGGFDSGIAVLNISASGPVMTFDIGRTPTPELVNDMFTSRALLSEATGQIPATNIGATQEPGEPVHGGIGGGQSVWWEWSPQASGTAVIHTAGSTFDTVLAVYAGSDVGALTLVASDNDSGPGNTSQVSFQAWQGLTYIIAVDGVGGASGDVVLGWSVSSQRRKINVSTAPYGVGSVGLDPMPGIDGKYPAGTVVEVTAYATGGYGFNSWSGPLNGAGNPAQVTLLTDFSVTANFARSITPQLNPLQKISIVADGAAGWQEIFYNFSTSAVAVTPWQGTNMAVRYALPKSQWMGIFHFDYASGRFTEAVYRVKDGL